MFDLCFHVCPMKLTTIECRKNKTVETTVVWTVLIFGIQLHVQHFLSWNDMKCCTWSIRNYKYWQSDKDINCSVVCFQSVRDSTLNPEVLINHLQLHLGYSVIYTIYTCVSCMVMWQELACTCRSSVLFLIKACLLIVIFVHSMLLILFCFSFSLLWGPVNHVKHLCSLERLPFTAAYFGSMFATLYMAMIVSIAEFKIWHLLLHCVITKSETLSAFRWYNYT